MKYPKYKYEFEIDGEIFLLAVGESKVSKHGVLVRVHKFSKHGIINHLSITCDGGVWQVLENGYRIPGGKLRQDFKKYAMNYPEVAGNIGHKSEEIVLCHEG